MLGFLGNMTLAPCHVTIGLVQHCCVFFSNTTILDGLSSIVMQQCKQAVVDFHNNMFCCLRTSTDIVSPCLEIAACRRACVWLRAHFGWKTELVFRDCTGWARTCVRRVVDCV
jgi:hypothetical protein